MTIGDKIKKFRTARGLSQKQLAIMAGMSEPAIRNYELGNRQPNEKQLQKIAGALEISPFAISDPDIESYHGLMHTLFALEDMYGVKPIEIDNQVYLAVENKSPIPSDVAERLQEWNRELTAFKNGEITQEEYDLWRHSYPRREVERTKLKLDILCKTKTNDNVT